jgi:hypothetical protein
MECRTRLAGPKSPEAAYTAFSSSIPQMPANPLGKALGALWQWTCEQPKRPIAKLKKKKKWFCAARAALVKA